MRIPGEMGLWLNTTSNKKKQATGWGNQEIDLRLRLPTGETFHCHELVAAFPAWFNSRIGQTRDAVEVFSGFPLDLVFV